MTNGTKNGPATRYGLAIIGSGPAGVSAARGYLEARGPGPVVLVTADSDPPYERPPLSKEVLAGEAAPQGQPIGGDPLQAAVEVRLDTPVEEVDLRTRTLRLGEDQLEFDHLVVAVGAHPNPMPVADEGAGIHLLRSLADARRLAAAAEDARSAVVVGSGFIGCEAAASLAHRGVRTTLVTPEDAPQIKRLGEEAGARLADWLTGAGVTLRTRVKVADIGASGTVDLDDGTTLEPDLVLAAVGVTPGGALLEGTGVDVHEGRIAADDHLAAAPGVWVAGDVARAQHALAGRPIQVEHWGDALAMGEIAGHNAAVAGRRTGSEDAHEGADGAAPRRWDTVPGFWSTIGDHTLKYAAWGDGYATAEMVPHAEGFTVWYADTAGKVVGVLTHNADDDYERGRTLIEKGATVERAVGRDG